MPAEIHSQLEFEFYMKPSDIHEFSHFLVDFKGQALLWDEHAQQRKVAELTEQRLDLASARKSFVVKDARDCHAQRVRALAEEGVAVPADVKLAS